MRAVAKSLRKFGPHPGTLISVGLVAAAHPPLEWTPLVWLAWVPWLWAIARTRSALDALGQGVWASVLLGFVATPWIAEAAMEYLELSRAAGLGALAVYACFHQLQLPLFALAFRWGIVSTGSHRGGPRGAAAVAVGAALYTGIDWVVPKMLRDTAGLLLHDHLWLSQTVEIGGIHLLTFLVIATNIAVLSALLSSRTRAVGAWTRIRLAVPACVTAGALLLGAAGFGAARLAALRSGVEAPTDSVGVGVVQGGIDRELKHRWARGDLSAAQETLAIHQQATDQLLRDLGPVDFVLWPETAYPGVFRKPETQGQLDMNVQFDRYIAARALPFLFGAYDREERTDARVLQNGLFIVSPGANQDTRTLSPMQVHHKSRLFPVGEYLPGLDGRRTREWLPGAASLSAGPAPVAHEIWIGHGSNHRPLRLGVAICYEDLFASHAIALARDGARLLVNVSDDTWFGDHGEPRLHLIVARLRSIETRLPQVRATGNGYSALILPTGELQNVSDYGRTQAFLARVPIEAAAPTLQTRWGDWFGPTSLAAGLIGALALRPRGSRPDDAQ